MLTTSDVGHLTRSDVWSSTLKTVLEDELMATTYVKWLTEFPDGDTFNIPSVGTMVAEDYQEDEAIKYRSLDTGNFTFTISKYKSSATYITNKAKQDAFYLNQLQAQFVPMQHRAIMEQVEADILGLQSAQTASDLNIINGAAHRFVASGANERIDTADFSKALYALKKANVPQTNLVAIVDPSVELGLNNITNLTNVSNNPRWEGIVSSGIATGMKFIVNIFGFDVYTSNNLSDVVETINGKSVTSGKANLFFSADSSILPFVGAWRQMPKVDSQYNMDKQREEYVTTARYGVGLLRPENLVTVLSDTDWV